MMAWAGTVSLWPKTVSLVGRETVVAFCCVFRCYLSNARCELDCTFTAHARIGPLETDGYPSTLISRTALPAEA